MGLLDEDLHDGSAHHHPHAVLLEHVQKRQEALLGRGRDIRNMLRNNNAVNVSRLDVTMDLLC